SVQALQGLLGEDASAVAGLPLPERTLQGHPPPVAAGASIRWPREAMSEGETPQSMVITEMGAPVFAGSEFALREEPQPPVRGSGRRGWRAAGLVLAFIAVVPAGIAVMRWMGRTDISPGSAMAS